MNKKIIIVLIAVIALVIMSVTAFAASQRKTSMDCNGSGTCVTTGVGCQGNGNCGMMQNGCCGMMGGK